MNKTSKIIVTIIVIIVFFVLFAIIVGVRESSGATTPGFLGLVIFAGTIGAIRAVWKSKNNQ